MSENKDTVDWNGYQDLLIPIGHRSDVNDLTTLSSYIVNKREGHINFLHIIREGSYSHLPHEWRVASDRLTESHHKMMTEGLNSNRNIRTAKSIVSGILEEAEEDDSDGIVLGWGPKPTSSISRLISKVMDRSDSDVLVFKNRELAEGVDRIFYPTAKKPDMNHLRIIKRIMKDTNATLTFAHVVDKTHSSREEGKEILRNAQKKARKIDINNSESLLATGSSLIGEISRLSEHFDLMLLGPSEGFWLKQTIFGRRTDKIANKANCSVLLHKAGEK